MNTSIDIDYANMHLLVAEDEKFMREMVRRVLEMIDVTKISEATDGSDGLQKLSLSHPT